MQMTQHVFCVNALGGGIKVTALALAKVARPSAQLFKRVLLHLTTLDCTALYFCVATGDPTGTGKGGKSIYTTPNGVPLLHLADASHCAAYLCACR
jgi:hypothetical protein